MGGLRLVGKDSVAVSREKLSWTWATCRQPGDAGFHRQDLGIKKSDVFAIEQPGEFHLDMRIMCAAPAR